jgi:hypothetical protein
MLDQFKLYQHSHPNLSHCWIAYLELKKRHCDEIIIQQCVSVLEQLANGCADWSQQDILSVLLYKRSV